MTAFVLAFLLGLAMLGASEVAAVRLVRLTVTSTVVGALASSGYLVRNRSTENGYATYLFTGTPVPLPRRTPGATAVPAPAADHETELPTRVLRLVIGRRWAARWATRGALYWRWYAENYVLQETLLADWPELSLPQYAVNPGRHRPWAPTARTTRRPYAWNWANEPTGDYPTLNHRGDEPVAGSDRCWLTLSARPSTPYLPLPVRVGEVPAWLDRLDLQIEQMNEEDEELRGVDPAGQSPERLARYGHNQTAAPVLRVPDQLPRIRPVRPVTGRLDDR